LAIIHNALETEERCFRSFLSERKDTDEMGENCSHNKTIPPVLRIPFLVIFYMQDCKIISDKTRFTIIFCSFATQNKSASRVSKRNILKSFEFLRYSYSQSLQQIKKSNHEKIKNCHINIILFLKPQHERSKQLIEDRF